MRRFYLDYNASTPLAPCVRKSLTDALHADLKNPSSIHEEGRKARREIESARAGIARLLDCRENEICFTSGATEANNMVFHSAWETRQAGRSKIVATSVEHPSVKKPIERLREKGAEVCLLPVDSRGEISPSELERIIDDRTQLVSVMTANNETGIVFPIRHIVSVAKKNGALFHTDAACAVGKMNLSFADLGADFLSLSGHKFYAPKGTGALVVRSGVPLIPLVSGGPQEMEKRGGTENVMGIIGLSAGLDFAMENFPAESDRLWKLRERLKNGLSGLDCRVIFHENAVNQLPGTLNVAFEGIPGRTLQAMLDLEGAAVSYGTACSSGTAEVSRVLPAMGFTEKEAAESIRISFGKMTTEDDVDEFLEIVRMTVLKMI